METIRLPGPPPTTKLLVRWMRFMQPHRRNSDLARDLGISRQRITEILRYQK
jgi:predicted transcriptional regulator